MLIHNIFILICSKYENNNVYLHQVIYMKNITDMNAIVYNLS